MAKMPVSVTGSPMHRVSAKLMAFVAAGMFVAGCGTGGLNGDPVSPEGQTALPADTLQDWVTYGDILTTATVESESQIDPPQEERDRGEGFISRHVRLRPAAAVWTRPTQTASATSDNPPATLDVANGGWVFHNGTKEPLTFDGQQVLSVGRQYVVVLTYGNLSIAGGDGSGKPEWFLLDAVPMDGAGAAAVPSAKTEQTPARTAVAGKTLDQIASLLSATPPDPAATPYLEDDPVLRYQEVQRAQGGSGEPARGEH